MTSREYPVLRTLTFFSLFFLIVLFDSYMRISDPCDVPLGMQDGRVSKGMLTASSMYNHYYGPWNARLHARNYGSIRGGWVAKYRNRNQWIQIDLGVVTRVKRIATQGRYDANQWVKSYTVSYSSDGSRFYPVKHGRRIKVTVRSLYSQIPVSSSLPADDLLACHKLLLKYVTKRLKRQNDYVLGGYITLKAEVSLLHGF